jgi:hypothetical protein
MRVTVVRAGVLGPGEVSLRATFQQSSPATLNPFLSLTFAGVVGRTGRVPALPWSKPTARSGPSCPSNWPHSSLTNMWELWRTETGREDTAELVETAW